MMSRSPTDTYEPRLYLTTGTARTVRAWTLSTITLPSTQALLWPLALHCARKQPRCER